MATRQKPKRPEDPIAMNMAKIVYRLMSSPKGWRIDLMCEELGIAERTFRKYRRLLQEAFPGFQREDGTSMVEQVRDAEGTYLRLVAPSRHDVEGQFDYLQRVAALHLARQMFHFVGETDLGSALHSATEELQRIRPDLNVALEHVLRYADRMLYLLPHAPKDYGDQQQTIRRLFNALLRNQVIEIDYHAAHSDEQKTYVLEPLTLLSWRSGLYLLARVRGQKKVKTYAIDRVIDVFPLDEHFVYPAEADYDPKKYTEGSFGLFLEEGGKKRQVVLTFANESWLKADLMERVWHPTQSFAKLPDGRLQMSFRVSSLVEVVPWVRSYGKQVQVVQPQELKDAVSEGE